MSRDNAHPALHTPPEKQHISPHSNIMGNSPELKRHFVPEGWEDLNRGCCPCGEVVVWDEKTEMWVPDRAMRVLVLNEREVSAVFDMLALSEDGEVPETRDQVMRQIGLQNEVEGYAQDPS